MRVLDLNEPANRLYLAECWNLLATNGIDKARLLVNNQSNIVWAEAYDLLHEPEHMLASRSRQRSRAAYWTIVKIIQGVCVCVGVWCAVCAFVLLRTSVPSQTSGTL
jgi:hypothetical protein